MKRSVYLVLFSILFVGMNAQKWVEMMQDTNANFYDIKKEFENYWKDRPYERGKGYKAFKRWADFVEPRVYPTGSMKNASRSKGYEEFQKFLQDNSTAKQIITASPSATTANWTPLGPFGSPVNGDAGRLQCIRFHPAGTNTIYVGTSAGGLWVSTNGGSSWTTNTDQLASLGVSDIAVDPVNPQNMYIATGDNDAGDTYAIGVLKSTNGGVTWSSTGLSWATSQQRRIGRLLINPQNPNKLIAATSVGVYRSFNGGATWTLSIGGSFKDAEYKPGDTTTIYAGGGTNLYKSTNGGVSFTGVSYSPVVTVNRSSIAVTPANPNVVYIVASNGADDSFGGLYRSTNSATTFSTMSTSPNIFDWSTNGSGSGGQGWYDLAIGASPTNSNEIVVGGVNSWRSTNGGTSWIINTHWYGGGGKPYVHADLHDVQYVSGTSWFLGTDGGIARTTNGGTTWTTINGAMNISQQYRLGNSASSASYIVTGHQDNGTNLLNGTAWSEIYGGDGADCFVDWSNNNIIVASYVNGDFQKSTNAGSTWSTIQSGLTGTAAWIAPICQNPSNANIFYCGYQEVFKSTNKGTSWTQLAPLGGGGDVLHITVAPSNTNVIYASRAASIFQTTNGGTSWNSITGSLPVGSALITGIAVDNTNPNNVYVSLSGWLSGNKVFYSNNGGISWTNYSTGLPNIPHNCIVYKNNSAGAVYVGTDVGVYYRELSMGSWIPYMNGLPNVVVDELEIYYPTGKLRAATYGRGTWQTDLYSNPSAPPFAYFTNAYTDACVNVPFVFSDASSNNPTSWSWSFPGGAPSTSTVQNPSVTFATAGIYTVSVIATNSVGSSAPYTTTISVVNTPTAQSTSDTICVGQTAVVTATSNASSIVWQGGQTGGTAYYTPSSTTVYQYTAATGACQYIGNSTVTVGAPPVTPTVTQTGNNLSSTSASSYQWYLNGNLISGATAQTYTATVSGWYSVWTSNGSCQSSSSAIYVTVTAIDEAFTLFNGMEITPNPASEDINLLFRNKDPKSVNYVITNNLGQVVKKGDFRAVDSDRMKIFLDRMAAGVYNITLSSDASSVNYKFVKQ
jgi:PKD repeat protein